MEFCGVWHRLHLIRSCGLFSALHQDPSFFASYSVSRQQEDVKLKRNGSHEHTAGKWRERCFWVLSERVPSIFLSPHLPLLATMETGSCDERFPYLNFFSGLACRSISDRCTLQTTVAFETPGDSRATLYSALKQRL